MRIFGVSIFTIILGIVLLYIGKKYGAMIPVLKSI